LEHHRFVNIDSSFAAQGEMFLVVFVKDYLHRHTSAVEHTNIPKGAGSLGTVSASQGGISYGVNVNGKMFNIVGVNLISRQIVKRFVKRN